MSDIPLFILYGSATGNAESIAKDLAAKYENNVPSPFNKVVICPANDFKKKCLPIWENAPPIDIAQKYGLVFVTSTTGNGDCPENASRFIRYLKRSTTAESQPLKHVAYGVLGLGDSNYDIFCANGIVADKKLQDNGGERVVDLGKADEATGLEEVVEAWVENIVPLLVKACAPSHFQIDDEEKKIDDTSINTGVGSRPSVQSILNQRMGLVPKDPTIPMAGSRPNVQALLNRRNISQSTPQSVESTESSNTVIAKKSMKSPSPLYILYGSATGNAEHIAKDLESKYNAMISSSNENCYFPSVVCCEMDQYKKKCLSRWEDDEGLDSSIGQKHGVLFISSTTGNGDPPENASRFVRLLKRKSTEQIFRHVAYAVLGLGDTNYDQFCETGKVIDKKVKELGGTRAQDVACADEGTGLEQVVDPWVENIFMLLSKKCRGDTSDISPPTNKPTKLNTETMLPSILTEVSNKLTEHSRNGEGTKCVTSCLGVSIIKQLLPDGVSDIPRVATSLLPSLGSSLSSCELLLHEDDENARKNSRAMSLSEIDRLTVSSGSSSSLHYTADNPFESTIVGARYLTQTKSDGANLANAILTRSDDTTQSDKITAAMNIIRDSFPLVGTNQDPKELETNGKRVIELTLSLPDDFTLEYQPGDSIGLLVANKASATDFVLDMLRKKHGIEANQKLSVNSKTPITVEKAISEQIDLCSPIKNKRLLFALSQFATDKEEADALKLLASKDLLGQKLFQLYIDEQKFTVVDVLQQFPSCQNITLEGLLAILPGIPPRYYSISSSPLCPSNSTQSLTVTFSVVDYMTPVLKAKGGSSFNRRITGLATSYLEVMCSPFLADQTFTDRAVAVERLRIFPKPSAEFRLPASLSTPFILIGPGTGVAPFIGFLKHRQAQVSALDSTKVAKTVSEGTWRGGFDIENEDLSVSKKDANGLILGADFRSTQSVGSISLYFGCRYSDHDWLYKNDMENLERAGLIKLNVAFSRDDPLNKCYVQDKLRLDSKSTMEQIRRGATIYICGDGNAMAKDVLNAIVDIVAEQNFFNDQDSLSKAREFVEDMKERKKLLLDIWS
jgi:sulfite reductase alpha subunit-like flavoprotein